MADVSTLAAKDKPQHAADLDLQMRRGGGERAVRPVISYKELDYYRSKNMITTVDVAMHMPNEKGVPSDMRTTIVAMPAEKYQKWWKQGYRPQNYVHVEPKPPVRWLASMVEDAIDKGESIPEQMVPDGYMGPRHRVVIPVTELEKDPTLDPDHAFACDLCSKYSGKTEVGLATHKNLMHKGWTNG